MIHRFLSRNYLLCLILIPGYKKTQSHYKIQYQIYQAMSTELAATEQVELTESTVVNAVESAPVEATPVSSEPSTLIVPQFLPQMPASQLRVSPQDIDKVFDELDFDKVDINHFFIPSYSSFYYFLLILYENIIICLSCILCNQSGSLDIQEFKAFVLGRFNLPVDFVTELFSKYDKDGSKTIDKPEFIEVVNKFNDIIKKFDDAEDAFSMGKMYQLAGIGYFMMCCCLCTAGCSYCAGAACSICVMDKVIKRIESKQRRLTEAVAFESMSR